MFFCAYLADADEGKAAEINGNFLHNFLRALTIAGAEKKMKRLLLTCGMKQYGVHLGQPKNPMDESDKWLEAPDRPPNFYYDQPILAAYAKNKHWVWVCTYPQDVIGVAKGNFMNLATSIGIYAAVNESLPGSELPFPGNEETYLALNIWTHSKLHAKFALWAMAEPKCANENFNVVNGDVDSWQTCGRRWLAVLAAQYLSDNLMARVPILARRCLRRGLPLTTALPNWVWKGDSNLISFISELT